jgi:hypothetical protein
MNYKTIQKKIIDTKLEFKNQSFGAIVTELKDLFFNAISIRHVFTKADALQCIMISQLVSYVKKH